MKEPKYEYVWVKIEQTRYKGETLQLVTVRDALNCDIWYHIGVFIVPLKIKKENIIEWLKENNEYFKGDN